MRSTKRKGERYKSSFSSCFTSSLAYLTCLLLLFVTLSPAWGSASLYHGANVLGTVATINGPSSGLWVSAQDVAELLGFSASKTDEELSLTREGTQLRLIIGAAAAWRDFSLIPLYAAPFEKNGQCWMDAQSAVSLFQKTLKKGTGGRLRFGNIATDDPVAPPDQPPARQPAEEPAPAIQEPPAQPEQPAVEPSAPPVRPQIPAPAQVRGKARPQARREIFQPQSGIPSDTHPSLNPGIIQRLRWSTSNNRIRAVADAGDGADPQVWMTADGVIHMLFSESSSSELAAPYENVKVTAKRDTGGVEIAFASQSVKVDKIVLNSPRRIVLDFYFPRETRILKAKAISPSPAPQPAGKPELPQPPSRPRPAPQPSGPGGRRLVVVDPGHGGKDPGASANGVREKDVNLKVGLFLEQELKAMGFDVLMTRRTDVYLKLQERTDIANNAGANLFVSVHVNALPSASRASGFEIYIMALPTDKDALALAKIENREYLEEKGTNAAEVDRRTEMLLRILGDMQQNNKISESTELAEVLFSAGKQDGIPMRRVAQAPFFVLRGAGMPAVLLETGFVTNATEAKLLSHSGYQQRIARAMAKGIRNYLK
ncbi:MAG: N-acetylmuramoyl-L-alanine amidase [Fretibacterium sp.]|nr:N-acetylmuramoyl-L-alanine amidase [Fretibacterium sp.]